MAYRIRVTLDVDYVPDGAGGALLGQNQSNLPGYGSSLGAGAAQAAQTLQIDVAEVVPGGNSPSSANFATALSQAATDLGTLLSTAGAYSGGTSTPLALAQAWSTGGP